jgi:hypothetical protein
MTPRQAKSGAVAFPLILLRPEDAMIETPFGIPQFECDTAEQEMWEANAAPEQLMDLVTETMGVWRGAEPSPSPTDFKDIQERTMDFAKDNAERDFTFACKVCNAKTTQEILTLHMEFVQDRMRTMVMKTQQLYRLLGDLSSQDAADRSGNATNVCHSNHML